MPGSRREVENARDEGVRFLFNRQPLALLGGERVEGVRVVETVLGEADARGRRSAADRAGQRSGARSRRGDHRVRLPPDPPPWLAAHGIELEHDGRIRVGRERSRCGWWLRRRERRRALLPFQTAHRKIFAGGDAVRGADLVVTAAYEGREAAASIVKTLLGRYR